MPSCAYRANFNTSDGTNGCEEMERGPRGRHFRRSIVIASPSSQLRMSRSDRHFNRMMIMMTCSLGRPSLRFLGGVMLRCVIHKTVTQKKSTMTTAERDEGRKG